MSTESLIYITADGIKYPLQGDKVSLLSEDGMGIPPIEYITQTGPFQHGETVEDYFLQPRVIDLIIRRNCRSRAEYWCERERFVDIIRPNRGEGILRKVLQDGTKRDLIVRIAQGPSFPSRNGWDQFALQESIRFIAHNPVWFNPNRKSAQYAPIAPPVATFPIQFPVQFVSFVLNTAIVYNGNWVDYPTIIVNGPISNLIITNTTTGEILQLYYSLLNGESAIFNLAYGIKTIIHSDGSNLIGYLSEDSDLATFHLEPGANNIQLLGSGIGANMAIIVYWYERFIALAGYCGRNIVGITP